MQHFRAHSAQRCAMSLRRRLGGAGGLVGITSSSRVMSVVCAFNDTFFTLFFVFLDFCVSVHCISTCERVFLSVDEAAVVLEPPSAFVLFSALATTGPLRDITVTWLRICDLTSLSSEAPLHLGDPLLVIDASDAIVLRDVVNLPVYGVLVCSAGKTEEEDALFLRFPLSQSLSSSEICYEAVQECIREGSTPVIVSIDEPSLLCSTTAAFRGPLWRRSLCIFQ